MFTQQLFELALNIQEPWYIKDIQFDVENKRLDIYIDFHKGSVFHYVSKKENINGDFKAHDTVDKEWRHLNFFEHECYLHARVPRLDINETVKRLIDPPWSGLSNGFTLLFEAIVLQLASHMPVHTVSRIINESDHEGLNSLIQAAKAKARGFRTFRYFKIVAFLITGKLDFAQLNKHYLPI